MPRGPARDLPRWTWLLLADEAVVMAGAQFRDIALPLFVVALWPSPRSYAAALLATLAPRVALGGRFGRLADRLPARTLLVVSYALRATAVAALLATGSLPAALGALALLAVGHGLYVPAMAHYQAGAGAGRVAALLGRLRMTSGVVQAALPMLAGVLVAAGGRALGFGVSLGAYVVAGALMLALPSAHAPAGPRPASRGAAGRLGVPGPILGLVLVVASLNALAWVANTLYVAYLLAGLHVGAARYGLALTLWGGAGVLSGWLLGRVGPDRLAGRTWLWLLPFVGAWAVMTRPVGYAVTALLGVPEGFATFLLLDLLQAQAIRLAPKGQRGAWTASASAWGAGGRVAGLVAVLVLPTFARVHQGFLALSLAMAVLVAATAAGPVRRALSARAEGPGAIGDRP